MRIAGAGEKNKNPYGSRSCPGPAPRRDDAGTDEPGRWTRRETARTSRCGARIGVVKLLRARGGCLGVIRIRAWKAAKSPGELPNERRARNARADPGN